MVAILLIFLLGGGEEVLLQEPSYRVLQQKQFRQPFARNLTFRYFVMLPGLGNVTVRKFREGCGSHVNVDEEDERAQRYHTEPDVEVQHVLELVPLETARVDVKCSVF